MTTIRKLLEWTLPITLAGAVVLDLVLIGAILVSKRELTAARAAYGDANGNTASPMPAGVSLGGTFWELGAQNAGYAVWYASSKCPYCQKDEEWRRLAALLEQRGVRIIVLLPSAADSFAGDKPLPGNALQVVYMNVEWLRRYPLSVTPTLLIFDREHRLVWHRYGMLRPADTRAALSALERHGTHLRPRASDD